MTDAAAAKAQAAHAGLEAPRTIVVIGGGQAAGWVVKTLRKEGFAGVAVALSGYGQPEDKLRAKKAGFDEHLVKPVDPSILEISLERPR